MSRQTFTDRNAWHFAVAASFPFARVATKVLTEARLTDGAEIAEWDFATNTGWMRSIVVPQAVPATDGHAGYLLEGGKAAWYVCEAHHDVFTVVDPKAYSSKDAAYQSSVFTRDNGSRDIIAVHGVMSADKKTVTPADLNEAKSVPTVFYEGGIEDWKTAVLAAHPTAGFVPTHVKGKVSGYEARVGGVGAGETVGSVAEVKPGVFRGGYRNALQEAASASWQAKVSLDEARQKGPTTGWYVVTERAGLIISQLWKTKTPVFATQEEAQACLDKNAGVMPHGAKVMSGSCDAYGFVKPHAV